MYTALVFVVLALTYRHDFVRGRQTGPNNWKNIAYTLKVVWAGRCYLYVRWLNDYYCLYTPDVYQHPPLWWRKTKYKIVTPLSGRENVPTY